MSFLVTPATTGGWLAFATGPRLLVVDGGDAAFIESAWRAVREPAGFQSLLDLLTSKGLSAAPAFALVEWEQGADARLIVRGAAALDVTDAAGTTAVTAAGASTWVERTVPGLLGLELTVPDAPPGAEALPLESGVSRIAKVGMGAAGAATAKPTTAKAAAPPAAVQPTAPVIPPAAAPPVASIIAPAAVKQAAPANLPVETDIGATIALSPDREDVPAADEPEKGSYDYLFGETQMRPVSEAAVREEVPEETPTEVDPASGDHDGHTVLTSDIAKLRGHRKSRGAAAAPLAQKPSKLVVVLSSTGAKEPLTQPILIGRSPSVSKVPGDRIPKLITVGSVDQDISRNHAQVALEGDTVVVTDLHSRNGTSVVLPGKESQKLRPGEPTAVIVGTVIDLGSGITLTVEDEG